MVAAAAAAAAAAEEEVAAAAAAAAVAFGGEAASSSNMSLEKNIGMYLMNGGLTYDTLYVHFRNVPHRPPQLV
jgi:hypothetical protein